LEAPDRQGYEETGLCKVAGISGTTVAKLGKGETVNTDILLKICNALDCDISDIMEVMSDKPKTDKNGGAD
jgi:DNA-binding Xre family transcriptional regulator